MMQKNFIYKERTYFMTTSYTLHCRWTKIKYHHLLLGVGLNFLELDQISGYWKFLRLYIPFISLV